MKGEEIQEDPTFFYHDYSSDSSEAPKEALKNWIEHPSDN